MEDDYSMHFRLSGVWLFLTFSSVAAVQAAPAVDASPSASPTSSPSPAAASTPVSEKTVSVTRVVGEVGSRVVTSREVRLNDAMAQVMVGLPALGSGGAKKKIVQPTDPAFPPTVLRVLDEWAVYFEATEIGAKSVDKDEVAKAVKSVGENWKDVADWTKLEPSAQEIKDSIERKLIVQNFERLKGDASLVTVSDAEAQQYYKKNRLRFGNLPFENFKDNIKAALVRSQTERRLFEWRAVLRRKYRVRNSVGA